MAALAVRRMDHECGMLYALQHWAGANFEQPSQEGIYIHIYIYIYIYATAQVWQRYMDDSYHHCPRFGSSACDSIMHNFKESSKRLSSVFVVFVQMIFAGNVVSI